MSNQENTDQQGDTQGHVSNPENTDQQGETRGHVSSQENTDRQGEMTHQRMATCAPRIHQIPGHDCKKEQIKITDQQGGVKQGMAACVWELGQIAAHCT